MADDMELNEKSLLRAGSLCSPDPYQHLLTAFNDRDFVTFKNILTSGTARKELDIDHVYDEPHYCSLLELALQKPANYQYVKALLDCGADPSKPNKAFKKTPLHFAVEFGDISYVNALLDDPRTNVNAPDNTGSPALHHAARSKNVDCMISLLNHPKIDVNHANRKGQTAMHIAAVFGTKETVLCLLQKENLDIDSYKTAQNKSGRDLIIENYPDLEEKLPSIYDLTDKTIDDDGDTSVTQNRLFNLLHKQEIDNFIRMIQVNKHLVDSNDGFHTFLQYSTEFGLYKQVEVLLRLGADPNTTHIGDTRTPVMIAAHKGFVDILRLFIVNENTKYHPINGETVLHHVIKGSGDTQSALGENKQIEKDHYKCLEMLLKQVPPSKLNINSGDIKGNTALHYAAKSGEKRLILLLLDHGAYIGQRNKLNQPALADVNPKIFETYLDNCLTTNDKLPREDNYEIIFRYNFLAPPKKYEQLSSSRTTLQIENNTNNIISNKDSDDEGQKDEIVSETEPLLYMSRSSDLRPLLKHPVLTSFLHLKWQRIKCFFYFNLTFYVLFWALLSSYILLAYLSISSNGSNIFTNKSNSSNVNEESDAGEGSRSLILRIFVAVFLIVLIIRELFQLTISPLRYLANPENWLEIGLIGITISILFCDSCVNLRHQISAVAILLSWAELVLLIGRHPALSTNIEMLKTVSWNFLKFLAWYSILIIAFALSFYTLFCDSTVDSDEENYFVDPAMSIFKTVVMLTGEFDAGSIPFVARPGTSHVLFVLFVFLIAIVLFNLLNGLAVSDTQAIKADAELVGYVSRVKLVSYVENMAMGDPVPYDGFLNKLKKLFCCLPDLNCCTVHYGCLKMFSRKINLFPDLYPDCEIRILPNQESKIEMHHQGHKRKRRDLESDSDETCCLDDCYRMTMDPEIVKAAKGVLSKKEDDKQSSNAANKLFESYRSQLEEYKRALDIVLKSNNKSLVVEDYGAEDKSKDKRIYDLSKRLDDYNDTLNKVIANSEGMLKGLNVLLKHFDLKKSIISTTSSSEEDNQ